MSRHPELARSWRVLSAETLSMPLALPLIMTSAPRWNTHAVIANVGPLHVAHSLAVHAAEAWKSARSWTIVVYTFPGRETAAYLGSGAGNPEEQWQEIQLAPGAYTIILRYYHWTDVIRFPEIMVDGKECVQPKVVAGTINEFYRDLAKRRSVFYAILHHYVFTMLRYRNWLPPAFVRRQVLPVENPETAFYFDAVQAGSRLHFTVDSSALDSFDILYTLYGRDSFPLEWDRIRTAEHTTAAADRDCFYVVRVHKMRFQDPRTCASVLEINVT